MTTKSRPIALVTGGNKGIGFAVCRQLAVRGHAVLLAARDDQRGRDATAALVRDGLDVTFVALDVTDQPSIDRAAARIAEAPGRLDVLVNNAGITVPEERPSRDRPSSTFRPSAVDAAAMRRTFEVNVFGAVAVTRAMLPLLQRSPALRIVNVSSPLGSLALHADPAHPVSRVGLMAYGASKSALNAVTLHYAAELRGRGLVNAANPGFVATDLNNHAGTRTVDEGAAIIVRLATLPDDGPTGVFLGDDGPVPW